MCDHFPPPSFSFSRPSYSFIFFLPPSLPLHFPPSLFIFLLMAAPSHAHFKLIEATKRGALEECRKICETGKDLGFGDALYTAALYNKPELMNFFYDMDKTALPAALLLAFQTKSMDQLAFKRLIPLLPGGEAVVAQMWVDFRKYE